jgi:redox-sensitive bicupin YhaK (pirin superfamily)
MEDLDTRQSPAGGHASDDVVLDTVELGFPWTTVDPFLVTVHHRDHYPVGDPGMAPTTTEGRRDAGATPSGPGWSMYYGDVVPGFPEHPHRGFETITVTRRGTIDHSDSLGATARYGGGDIQWLTAGRGIQHAEMFPLLDQDGPNTSELFQIWLNLPAADKMVEPYFTMFWREDVPRTVLKDDDGHTTEVTVVAGAFGDLRPLAPPPESWAARPESDLAIWQFEAEASALWTLPPAADTDTVRMLYLFEGSATVGDRTLVAPVGVMLRPDVAARIQAGADGASALVLQGRPIGEPVAMGGPFVMNTREEIEDAYRDYRRTGFGGWPWATPDPVHSRSTPRFAHHPDGRTEYPEDDPDRPGRRT